VQEKTGIEETKNDLHTYIDTRIILVGWTSGTRWRRIHPPAVGYRAGSIRV
jgi:hypothetical protein